MGPALLRTRLALSPHSTFGNLYLPFISASSVTPPEHQYCGPCLWDIGRAKIHPPIFTVGKRRHPALSAAPSSACRGCRTLTPTAERGTLWAANTASSAAGQLPRGQHSSKGSSRGRVFSLEVWEAFHQLLPILGTTVPDSGAMRVPHS